MKYSWQMPEKWNKRIVRSRFRRASTVVFNLKRNQDTEGSAIQTIRKNGGLLHQNPFKKEGEKACLDNWNGGGNWQLSLPSRGVLNIICCWDASSVRSSGKDQHLGKPKFTTARTGCVQVTLTLISQPKPVVCCGPHFLFGFKKICLLEARHEASTWWNIEKLGSKSHNPHSCFGTIFQHWSGPGKTPTRSKANQNKVKKLSKTETPSSSKN